MDTIKGLALIGTFIGVLTIFAMWVSLWESVWQASRDSTQSAWAFTLPSLILDVVADSGLSADIVTAVAVHFESNRE